MLFCSSATISKDSSEGNSDRWAPTMAFLCKASGRSPRFRGLVFGVSFKGLWNGQAERKAEGTQDERWTEENRRNEV